MKRLLFLGWLAIAALASSPFCQADPTQDGLYAGFVTTQGTIWARLEYQRVPRTVANFMNLAEGAREWVDFTSAKLIRKPYYPGIIFHRVIDHFMIQGGSPNGRGTDGPGYSFADEFHAELKHDTEGTLSMANSGPNSNGSQFFITVTNTPWLDGKHTVFGKVVEGMAVAHAISMVPRDTADRPLVPVVINELRILRIGEAATAFNPAAVNPPLPDVGHVPAALSVTSSNLTLFLQPRTNHMQHAFFGTNFVSWKSQTFRGTPSALDATALLGPDRLFFVVLDGGLEP